MDATMGGRGCAWEVPHAPRVPRSGPLSCGPPTTVVVWPGPTCVTSCRPGGRDPVVHVGTGTLRTTPTFLFPDEVRPISSRSTLEPTPPVLVLGPCRGVCRCYQSSGFYGR